MGRKLNLDEIAAAFVTAGAGGGDWLEPLGLAEERFGARGAILMTYQAKLGQAPFVEIAASAGMPALTESYKSDFAALDQRAAFCFGAKPGLFLHDDMIAAPAVRARMPIYADFLDRFDIGQFAAVNLGAVGATPGASTFFSLSLPNDASQFDGARTQGLTGLARFVRAAVRTASVINTFAAPQAHLREALERRAIAAFMIDREGMLLDLNTAGRRLAATGQFMSLSKGVLGFVDADAQVQLDLARRADWRLRASDAWCARARDGSCAEIVALNGLGRDLGLRADALLLLVVRPLASAKRVDPRIDFWRTRLGLDQSQAQLARTLVDDGDPIELAFMRDLTPAALDRNLRGMCVTLGVQDLEAARFLLLSAARPN